MASRRLRGGFAGASQRLRENVPSFLAKPSLKRTVLFRSSYRNLPVILSQPANSKHQPLEYYCHESAQHTCHESTQYAQTTKWLREVASPVSMLPGYAKWLRGASRYTMYRTSAFAELFGVPHEAKIHHLRKKTLLNWGQCAAANLPQHQAEHSDGAK